MPAFSSRAPWRARTALTLSAVAILTGCNLTSPGPTLEPAAVSDAPPGNLTEGCVERHEEGRDYFPERVRFRHATGVRVAYTRNTKLLEISRPWKDAESAVRVLLVQCGTPTPTDVEADLVVPVPVERVVTFSTTQLPPFVSLGRPEAVVAHGGLAYVTTPEVRAAAAEGHVAEVGDQTDPDLERLAEVEADVALVSAGIVDDTQRQLVRRVGLPVLPYADWLEESLLGRAEWAKVVAMLLNEEAAAEERFTAIEDAYADVVRRAARQDETPRVLLGMPYDGVWYMPAGDSYAARALRELGADYPWANTSGTGALSLDLETVLAEASDATVWLAAGSTRRSLEDLAGLDERFRSLSAFRSGTVYADDAAAEPDGGNPVFELGAVRPDLLIADLFKALYPEAAREVAFTFHGLVGSAAEVG